MRRFCFGDQHRVDYFVSGDYLAYRAQMGAADPTDVFIPLLLTSYLGTLSALALTGAIQRLKLLDPVVLAYLAGLEHAGAGQRLVVCSPASRTDAGAVVLAEQCRTVGHDWRCCCWRRCIQGKCLRQFY